MIQFELFHDYYLMCMLLYLNEMNDHDNMKPRNHTYINFYFISFKILTTRTREHINSTRDNTDDNRNI
jgi:Mg2+ and Co2+ transporter CorA